MLQLIGSNLINPTYAEEPPAQVCPSEPKWQEVIDRTDSYNAIDRSALDAAVAARNKFPELPLFGSWNWIVGEGHRDEAPIYESDSEVKDAEATRRYLNDNGREWLRPNPLHRAVRLCLYWTCLSGGAFLPCTCPVGIAASAGIGVLGSAKQIQLWIRDAQRARRAKREIEPLSPVATTDQILTFKGELTPELVAERLEAYHQATQLSLNALQQSLSASSDQDLISQDIHPETYRRLTSQAIVDILQSRIKLWVQAKGFVARHCIELAWRKVGVRN